MRLRTRLKKEQRDPIMCSVSRCNDPPTIIDATQKHDDCNVHYCDRHWAKRCEDDEVAIEGAA